MKRSASAEWNGDLKSGKGTVSTASGVLSRTQYSFGTRFENGIGTNPEELVAAAHAGCFTMALSAQLGEARLVPQSLETQASICRSPDAFRAPTRRSFSSALPPQRQTARSLDC
jgi:lipoyl-dependent peroxiredoxin